MSLGVERKTKPFVVCLKAISLSAPEHTIGVFQPVGLGERLAANFFANFREDQDGCEQL
jgi:hypothetical protein